LGIDGFINDLHGVELLTKNYYMPTANICGIISGYTGEGSKTVLPGEASAKMDFRLVPGQDPGKILELLKAHMHKHGFDDIELIVHSAQEPFRSAPDSPFVKAVYNTLNDLFGKPVVHYMVSGTSPMPVFCKEKNIPAALFGCISSTANIHAPNEHLAVSSYMDEIKMIAGVMEALGKL
jgi:acetylornithine deacetylase/succinyl-diaminopimelate desuccinylase-like protein